VWQWHCRIHMCERIYLQHSYAPQVPIYMLKIALTCDGDFCPWRKLISRGSVVVCTPRNTYVVRASQSQLKKNRWHRRRRAFRVYLSEIACGKMDAAVIVTDGLATNRIPAAIGVLLLSCCGNETKFKNNND